MKFKKDERVLIEKFQGYDIYYVKYENAFVADDEVHNLHFRAMSLFQLECDIKSSKLEAMDKEVFLKTGYFGMELSRVKILSINKVTKEFNYKILACTDSQYEVGHIRERQELEKFYEVTEENKEIYNRVKELQEQITQLEQKQKAWIMKLR